MVYRLVVGFALLSVDEGWMVGASAVELDVTGIEKCGVVGVVMVMELMVTVVTCPDLVVMVCQAVFLVSFCCLETTLGNSSSRH